MQYADDIVSIMNKVWWAAPAAAVLIAGGAITASVLSANAAPDPTVSTPSAPPSGAPTIAAPETFSVTDTPTPTPPTVVVKSAPNPAPAPVQTQEANVTDQPGTGPTPGGTDANGTKLPPIGYPSDPDNSGAGN